MLLTHLSALKPHAERGLETPLVSPSSKNPLRALRLCGSFFPSTLYGII
jgi:hypothetical protein